MNNLSQQAYQFLIQENYEQAEILYEKAIEEFPTITSNYWYLGLVLLLQGQEEQAQTTWLSLMIEAESDQEDLWTTELIQILKTETQRRESLEDYQVAWVIRQYLREITPDDFNNLLHLILLSVNLEMIEEYKSFALQAAKRISLITPKEFDFVLFLQVLEKIFDLDNSSEISQKLSINCLDFAHKYNSFRQFLITKSTNLLSQGNLSKDAFIQFAEIILNFQPKNIPVLVNLVNAYQDVGRYAESIKFAEQFLSLAQTLLDKIAAHYLLIRGLMQGGGQFHRAKRLHQAYQKLLHSLIQSEIKIDKNHIFNLISATSFFSYFDDTPEQTHQFRCQFSSFWQAKVKAYLETELTQDLEIKLSSRLQKNKILKIGYISGCLRQHSIGHLGRWLLEHHDRNRFEIYAYSLKKTDDYIQQLIAQICKFRDFSSTKQIGKILEAIIQDEIDVLVDLDSLTSRKGCAVMALKPAPVQVTWLGFDASGLPAIDYFIADPYVLPKSAQNYYQQRIWQLPQTYIAVDGFDVGVPTLRRDELGIPNDAVVYFSSQTGYKRHPKNVRSQIKILKAVPNSYFLIKGLNTDQDSVQKFFEEIATVEGVTSDRLKFLPDVPAESLHRANLGIADVVLDTYPYNGATTTLETLWMGIPLVTQVGEQFAARNSYTMMINVGVEEGIAWSDEEYIEWGIRLGKESKLRQKISWKLRQSRQNSPLWNGKRFTREMEDAYQQMWQRYRVSQMDEDT